MVIPNEVTAGVSVKFRVRFPDYPAKEWNATLYLRSSNHKVDLLASKEGNEFVFSSSATDTANWKPGLYSAFIRVSKGEETHQPVSERLNVLPDLAIADNYDPRTDAEKALEAIQATLSNRASSDQLKMSFNGRSLEKTTIAELLALESRYIKKVNTERRKKAGKGPMKINRVRLS